MSSCPRDRTKYELVCTLSLRHRKKGVDLNIVFHIESAYRWKVVPDAMYQCMVDLCEMQTVSLL